MPLARTVVVIPNWNGKEALRVCLKSLANQTYDHHVVVVDNGSHDGSVEMVDDEFPKITLIKNAKNLGFTGGVNPGLAWAIENDYQYAALLNNDAVADKEWLGKLVRFLEENNEAGIVTSKICDAEKTHLDSTGECFSIWGLPYPRGRGEKFSDKYDKDKWIFGASGGASLYRISMLKEIGLFDQKFFAYYEDVDLSFRAQLAAWRVGFEPQAVVYHEIGATSGKIKGFTTYHTIKNLPIIFWKDLPAVLMFKIFPRLFLAYMLFILRAFSRGQIWPALKGILLSALYFPQMLIDRHRIQSRRKVDINYIDSIITHDLPTNATNLRRLRSGWRLLTLRKGG